MSNIDYEHYRRETINLVKTMIVKHEEIALTMNNELAYVGYYSYLDDNPYNSRYYLNLNGQYHQYDIDLLLREHGVPYIMVKIASDIGTVEVPFTKELLHGPNANKALANEYQIGSRFYNLLVEKYPEHEQLIIGILNPIDMDVAIHAKNGEILYIDGLYKTIEPDGNRVFLPRHPQPYGKYIQPQEINLIPKLQTFLYNHLRNWNNQEYIIGNDLYAATMLGILYVHLPSVIMNIRLGNCKTPHAHRFHIKQYLESFGQNGRYIQFLSLDSALYLYRNTLWMEANRGKELVLNTYIDKLLTPNQIPVNAYSIKHDNSQMSRDNLLPHGILYKEVLNFASVGASDSDREVREILKDQVPLARDNERDLDYADAKIQETIDWGGDDRLQTKILESEIFDRGEVYPFTLLEMLINLWGYTSFKGYYSGSVFATHPISGDRLGLTALNAYLLASYCLNAVFKHKEFTHIPEYKFYHIPRTNIPSNYPTETVFEPKPDLEKAWSWCVQNKTRKRKVSEVLGTHKPKFIAHSPADFYINGKEIYDERVRKYLAYCNTEWLEERGDLHLIAERCYWMGFTEQAPRVHGMPYAEWLTIAGVDTTNFTRYDYLKLGTELTFNAIGITDEQLSKKGWTQKALLKILEHFTSYTIHWLQKYLDTEVRSLNGQTLRFSNLKWQYVKGKDGKPFTYKYRIGCVYSYEYLIKNKVWFRLVDPFEMTSLKGVMKLVADLRIPNIVSNVKFPHQQHVFYNLGLEAMNIVGKRLPKVYDPFPPVAPPDKLYEPTYLSSKRYPLETIDTLDFELWKFKARDIDIVEIKEQFGFELDAFKAEIIFDKFKDTPPAKDVNVFTYASSKLYMPINPDTMGITLEGFNANIYVNRFVEVPESVNVYEYEYLRSPLRPIAPDSVGMSLDSFRAREFTDPFEEVPESMNVYEHYYAKSGLYKLNIGPETYGIELVDFVSKEFTYPANKETVVMNADMTIEISSKWTKRTMHMDYPTIVNTVGAVNLANANLLDMNISSGVNDINIITRKGTEVHPLSFENIMVDLDSVDVEVKETNIPLISGNANDSFAFELVEFKVQIQFK